MPRQYLIVAQRTLAITTVTLALFLAAWLYTDHHLLSAALALVLSALLWKWWRLQLSGICRAKKFACVLPGQLYRSGQISHYQIHRILRRHRIRTIVDLSEQQPQPDPHQQAEQRAIARLGIQGNRYAMCGNGTGEFTVVADALICLHRSIAANRPVLVHCVAGVQRTGHVLAAYLLLVKQVPPEAVLDYLERFGWKPHSDKAWSEQLNQRMLPLATRLQEAGVISTLPRQLPQLPLHAAPRPTAPWWHSHRSVIAKHAIQPIDRPSAAA